MGYIPGDAEEGDLSIGVDGLGGDSSSAMGMLTKLPRRLRKRKMRKSSGGRPRYSTKTALRRREMMGISIRSQSRSMVK